MRSFIEPRPTLFDVLVGGYFFIPYISNDFFRSMALVMYAFLLYVLSLSMTPKREYKSVPLMLLGVWSFINMFVHNFVVYHVSSTMMKYFNFFLTVEGFLYILAGIMFIRTVVMYATNPRIWYFFIPVAVYPMFKGLVRTGNMTLIMSVMVSVFIYFVLSKKWKWVISSGIVGGLFTIFNWAWICMKFRCRPFIWGQLLRNSFYHPIREVDGQVIDTGIQLSKGFEVWCQAWIPNFTQVKPWLASIFGAGFAEHVNGPYTWVDKDLYGWVYRQNDYLALSEYLGPIVLIFLAWFIIESVIRIGVRPILILFMSVCLVPFFSFTMYDPLKAGTVLVIGALTITDGLRRNE